jgi:hypothetical protein
VQSQLRKEELDLTWTVVLHDTFQDPWSPLVSCEVSDMARESYTQRWAEPGRGFLYELRDDESAMTVLGQNQSVLQADTLPLQQRCGRHGLDAILQQSASIRPKSQGHKSILLVVAVNGIETQRPPRNHGGAQGGAQ